MLKVWWVYAGYNYYPGPALSDLQDTFINQEKAEAFASTLKNSTLDFDWVKVVDISEYLMDN